MRDLQFQQKDILGKQKIIMFSFLSIQQFFRVTSTRAQQFRIRLYYVKRENFQLALS